MFINCPKCGSSFNVDESLIKAPKMKFQCCDCSFVWDEDIDTFNQSSDIEYESQELPACLKDKQDLEEDVVLKTSSSNSAVLSFKYILIISLFFIFVGLIYLSGQFMDFKNSIKSNTNIPDKVEEKKIVSNDLYIELIQPLKRVVEGGNTYVIIKGFIHNPSAKDIDIPKVVIKLLNKDGRILQEQEREVDMKTLSAASKLEFLFKVFMFSPQLKTVVVDFVDVNKI